MIQRSSRSTTEAPVQSGRAPRRVSSLFSCVTRATGVLVVAVATSLLLAPVAHAQGPVDPEVAAVLDTVTPEMPGVRLGVETTPLGSQFVLENPTDTEVTVLSTAGDPLFRVGPGGVLANFRSPDWYTSKEPDGAATIPERATPGGVPVWARVSQEPAWGWFDGRLRTGALTAEQKAGTEPLAPFGSWSLPLQYGDALGSVEGHFEYRPALGTFTPELGETNPTPEITLSALPGNPIPAIAVQNTGPQEVIVLGDAGEPYLRITSSGAEANTLSPTWLATRDASAVEGDPAAAPLWELVGATGLHTFTIDRAGPEQDAAGLYALTEPTVVREWTLSLLVDGRPVDIDGTTTLTPIGSGGGWSGWLIAGIVVVALAVVGLVIWLARRRRTAGRPPSGRRRAAGRAPVGAGR